MPLPPAVPREPMHVRQVECRGYRRADGLWDIEGHLVDTKSYAFDNAWRGKVEPGTPVHEMWIRLTLDTDLRIHAVAASTDFSPYEICAGITPAFQKLVGLRIAPGFTAKTKELLGGDKGCTHLVELLGPMATTAFQTIFTAKGGGKWRDPGARGKPRFLDTCHALASSSDVVKRFWPEFYKEPANQ